MRKYIKLLPHYAIAASQIYYRILLLHIYKSVITSNQI